MNTGLHPTVEPHWPPKRSISVAEVVAGAEMGREVGTGAAAAAGAAVVAVAVAVGATAAGAAAASASASDSPSARRASEAPSEAAGAAKQVYPIIQMPRPRYKREERNSKIKK